MKKIDLVCFGLQGFGNQLLQAASDDERVGLKAFYTRRQIFEFSFYECKTLEKEAEERGVPLYYVPEKGPWDCMPASLAIVSSFHRIFKKEHLEKYGHVINIHPSLLPSYKGATPTNWMAKNGEKIIGVSAHLVDETIDGGAVLFQRKVLNPYLDDNHLHKLLAFTTRQVILDIIDSYPSYVPLKKITATESSFPKRTVEDATIRVEDLDSVEQLIFHIKAFTNYPMPRLQVNGRNFIVDYNRPRDFLDIVVEKESFEVPGYWERAEQ